MNVGEENTDVFSDWELVHGHSFRVRFTFLTAGKGPGRPKDGSPTLAGPLVQGKSLEIKVKAPCCCPKASGFRKAAGPPATREEGRKLFKFLIKL